MRKFPILKAGLAASAVLLAISSASIAQEGDFTFRWQLFGTGTDGPGPEDPDPEDPVTPIGPIISDPTPDGGDPGPGDFAMAKSTSLAAPKFAYQCFQVTSGSGNYAFDAEFATDPPAWVRGIDVVPASQISKPFTAFGQGIANYPGVPGATVQETSACARVAYDAFPTGGFAVTLMFFGMDFTAPTYTGNIYSQMVGSQAFLFSVTPNEAGTPDDGLPPVIVGKAQIGTGYPNSPPSTEFLETDANGAVPLSVAVTEWPPHTDGQGVTAPNSTYCYYVSGGYGNFIYAFALDVHQDVSSGDGPRWDLVHANPGVYAQGTTSVLPGTTTTTNRNICVNFKKGGNVDSFDATFLLQVLDYQAPGLKANFDGRASMLRLGWRDFIAPSPPDGDGPIGPPT